MRDSLDDLESDLGRLPDLRTSADQPSPSSQPSASSAQQIRRALRGKHVCPFCGTQRETDLGPCMHCSLEDTPTTRSATRSKLGPWYVLQSRNPSAPGMNFATLMVLVQKGRVTARSVVRGPTTGQFWRHAAKIKGVSREFGMCWNCGGDVGRTARACPSCKRLQEPPLNPDVLLEAGEMNGEELAEAMWSDQTPTSSQMSASSQVSPRAAGASSPVDRLVSRGGVRREVPADIAGVGNLPPRTTRGVLSEAAENTPATSLEMAMFQMPKSYEALNGKRQRKHALPGHDRPRASRRVLKALLVAVLLAAAGVVLLCTFDPDGAGRKLRTLGEKAVARVKAMIDGDSAATTRYTVDPALVDPTYPKANGNNAVYAPADKPPRPATTDAASIDQPKVKVWELYNAGKAADLRGDFAGALRNWEAIKALGLKDDDLPLDLNARISKAKERLR